MIVEAVLDANIIFTGDETGRPAVRPILRKRGWREERSDGILYTPGWLCERAKGRIRI